MAETILYSFRRCPYAMRARMALRISALAYEHREVVLRDKPAEMLRASPKGTVPVLVTGAGVVVDESRDIMRWALVQNDPEAWLERDDPALIDTIDGPFKHHLDRYKYAARYEGVDPEAHRAAALDMLQQLEARLALSGYLCGAQRGLADIAVFPFVRQFAHTDAGWFDAQPIPAVQTWLTALTGSQLFAAIMVRHAPWQGAA